MPFNVEDFKASINKSNGFSYAHTYTFTIESMPSVINMPNVKDDIPLRCESVLLPSRSLTTIDNKYGTQSVRKIGTSANYVDIQSEIILSSDLREREMFMRWQDLVVGNHRNERNNNFFSVQNSFNTGYLDSYKGQVTIKKYDLDATGVEDWRYKVTLKDCYPQQVGAQQTSWQTPEYEKLSVIWSYHYILDQYRPREGELNLAKPSGFFKSLFNKAKNIF